MLADAGAVYEGVNKLQNEKSDVPSSAESRGVAHLLMGAGVVLVKKYDGIGPAPPRLRVFWWLRNFFSSRIHPSSAEEGTLLSPANSFTPS